MALVDAMPSYSVQSPAGRIVQAIAKWFSDIGVRRRKRVALQSLLFAPEHRLRDLGISREEVLRAMRGDDERGNNR